MIDANQAGSDNFSAAPQVQQTFTVGKGAQAIVFTSTAPTTAVPGGPTYTPTATGGPSGNPVVFSIDASATGVCSITGGVVSFAAAGSCVIDANQAGNTNFNPAPQARQTVTVGKRAQTITFTSIAPTEAVVGGPTYTPMASGGGSGNAVVLSIDASATSACSISSGVVSFTAVGSCVIDANQAGNAEFSPAPQVQQTVLVGKRAQTITFTSKAPTGAVIGGPTYTPTATGGASGNPVIFSIDASATSVCSITGGVVSFAAAGSCVIDANQAGNANYNPAPRVQQAVSVVAVLGAPTGLRATAGFERIKLSWIAPADHGGSSVIGYRVYRGTSPGGESATPLATLPAGQTSFTDAAVTPGVTYYYVVRAFNAAGSSAPSAEAHATVTASAAGGSRLAVKPDRSGYWVLQPGGAVRALRHCNQFRLSGRPTHQRPGRGDGGHSGRAWLLAGCFRWRCVCLWRRQVLGVDGRCAAQRAGRGDDGHSGRAWLLAGCFRWRCVCLWRRQVLGVDGRCAAQRAGRGHGGHSGRAWLLAGCFRWRCVCLWRRQVLGVDGRCAAQQADRGHGGHPGRAWLLAGCFRWRCVHVRRRRILWIHRRLRGPQSGRRSVLQSRRPWLLRGRQHGPTHHFRDLIGPNLGTTQCPSRNNQDKKETGAVTRWAERDAPVNVDLARSGRSRPFAGIGFATGTEWQVTSQGRATTRASLTRPVRLGDG